MAKTTAPLLGFDALGSIGKETTYSKWKGTTYAKRHRAPFNPSTTAQELARDTLAVANMFWKTAPALFRETWARAADRRPLSGYNIFVGRFIADNLGEPGLGQFIFAPKVAGGVGPKAVILVAGSQQITVNIAPGSIPIGWALDAIIGGAIRNQSPSTDGFPIITVGETTPPPGTVVLTGLTPGVLYGATGWVRWILPTGKKAYSRSFQIQGAVPLP